MARGREGAAKRARERARQARQAEKRARRHGTGPGGDETAEPAEPVDEAALMEEFRVLSERHAAGELDDEVLAEERHRIFVALGIESDEEA